jgi:hypothetical protein
VNIKEAALMSVEATNLEGEFEARVSDEIAVGATYDQNSAQFAPKALFTRWTAKGGDPLEVKGTFHVADQSAAVDVEYEKLGSKFGVNFNSARPMLITAARTSRDFSVEGRNVNVAPSYNFATGVSSVKSKLALTRAGKESEIPNFKGSYLGRFPLVSADFWTSDHLSERSRSVDAFFGTRARGTLMLKRT